MQKHHRGPAARFHVVNTALGNGNVVDQITLNKHGASFVGDGRFDVAGAGQRLACDVTGWNSGSQLEGRLDIRACRAIIVPDLFKERSRCRIRS